ncbi:MAG TPA: SOS response-associated peptidase family protein [Steroidobacteraceae bacterium]|jgi:putative SOS response-associated peptidase YedK|nr:SOS response-associated peptidase family protein [Steroidobacteraceae bacterium]
MCYSAKVEQNIRDLARHFAATLDYSEVERLMMERLAGRPIRLARGFEWNFSNPQSAQERRIQELDAEYRSKKTTGNEQEVFKQKKRLADAERKLKVKETKAALNERRVATSKIEASLERIALLTGTQPHEDDNRIFPMTYAPIILQRDGRNVITLARYHLRQKGKLAFTDQKFPGLYNARRDNLERFWRSEFGRTHALLVVDSFYENVERDRKNVVLHFTPRPAYQLLVACLYADWSDPKEGRLLSFAAVTDEPPPEIKAAGHDRCIINLREENVEAWLTPQGRSDEELQKLLSDRQTPYYEHEVAAA